MISVRVNTDWGIEDYAFFVEDLKSFSFKDILDMLRYAANRNKKCFAELNKADLDKMQNYLDVLKNMLKEKQTYER